MNLNANIQKLKFVSFMSYYFYIPVLSQYKTIHFLILYL